ncbi:C2 domain-containing protein [Lactarius akahatsu]|uniref:C2 domain-containing protein n=1 Tax=Lactarius akahatsu TaxID=416441 RepID=A0AAD4LG96_9AGAM|nr:C2 domain-containing protein [Lactarius akahatsu]
MRLHIPILSRGSSRDSSESSPSPGETPVVYLRVQVISCQDLEAKDRNGYSDPFVIVSLLAERFQTPVRESNLNPVYDKDATFDFPIYMSLVHKLGTLDFVVWDKDRIRNDYMGEYSLPVDRWIEGTAFAFDDPDNEPFSVGLISSRSTKPVPGSMLIKVGFVRSPGSTRQVDFEKTYNALIANNNHVKVGVVMVEICGAKDLPKWRTVTLTGYDMDPFVEVSIGEEVQRTTVINHTRNPDWNEHLFFHVGQDDLSLPIRLTVFDRDKFTADDYVGEAEIFIDTLIKKADLNTWPYPADLSTLSEFKAPLNPVKKQGRVYNPAPTITFRSYSQSQLSA